MCTSALEFSLFPDFLQYFLPVLFYLFCSFLDLITDFIFTLTNKEASKISQNSFTLQTQNVVKDFKPYSLESSSLWQTCIYQHSQNFWKHSWNHHQNHILLLVAMEITSSASLHLSLFTIYFKKESK